MELYSRHLSLLIHSSSGCLIDSFSSLKSVSLGMEKRQVLLIHMQPLLGEGLCLIFEKLDEFKLVCIPYHDLPKTGADWMRFHPQVVLLAGEKEDDSATHLISCLLKQFENIPVVWVELETNILRLYTSHSLAANSADLFNAIRDLDANPIEIVPLEKKIRSGPRR